MPRCPRCAAESLRELPVCPACGYAETTVRCDRCGEEYQGVDACPACGSLRAEVPCDEHPGLVAVGRCVICGGAVCTTCDRGDGHATLCAEHAGVVVIQGWAQVYTTTSEFEAQLLRENLLAEGLDARIFSQKDNMLSVDLGELSIVRLLVPAWDHSRAYTVIRDHMDRSGEVTFACPECGDAYEPGMVHCSSCGTVLTNLPAKGRE